jgi:hypothetical protein
VEAVHGHQEGQRLGQDLLRDLRAAVAALCHQVARARVDEAVGACLDAGRAALGMVEEHDVDHGLMAADVDGACRHLNGRTQFLR